MAKARRFTAAEYAELRRGGAVEFEDDTEAPIPSRVIVIDPPPKAGLVDALGADQATDAIGVARMLMRAVGYCFVYLLWGVIFSVGALIAMAISPGHSMPLWAVVVCVNLWGAAGVFVQYRLNRRRRLKASGRYRLR